MVKLCTSQSRRILARWVGWFLVANTLLYFSIGLNYLIFMPNFGSIPLMTHSGIVLGWAFMLSGLLGQFALFAFLASVPVLLFSICYPRRWLSFSIGILLATV